MRQVAPILALGVVETEIGQPPQFGTQSSKEAPGGFGDQRVGLRIAGKSAVRLQPRGCEQQTRDY